MSAAHAPQSVGQRRDPVALLDAQLLRPGDAQLAPVRRQRAQHRQLVDDSRHLRRRDLGRAQVPVAHRDRARLARRSRAAAALDVDVRPPIRRRTSMMPVRVGFRPTEAITISEPESDAAATIQNAADEMSPGTSRLRPPRRWPPATDTERPRASTRTPNACSARSV